MFLKIQIIIFLAQLQLRSLRSCKTCEEGSLGYLALRSAEHGGQARQVRQILELVCLSINILHVPSILEGKDGVQTLGLGRRDGTKQHKIPSLRWP